MTVSTPESTAAAPSSEPADKPLPRIRVKAKRLNFACQNLVTLTRGEQRIERAVYLDDGDDVERFVDAATERIFIEGENVKELRFEILMLMRAAFAEARIYHDRILLEPLSRAMPYEVEWLWPGRIAADKLTMIVGDPGIGKSLVALDIAARVSTGRLWPDEPCETEPREPGRVLLLAELDDPDDTLRPRLEALDADLERITLVRSYARATGDEPLTVPFSVGGKLKMLSDCIQRTPDCKLVIIDPLSAYVDANYARKDLAELQQDLIEIAVSEGVAIVVVSHFSRGSHALFHCGSQANSRFVASARSVWKIVGDASHRDQRLLLPLKNNLGKDWLGMGFHIESSVDNPAPHVVWQSTPMEIAVERTTFNQNEPSALPNSYAVHRKLVCQWLRDQLRSGERFAQDILTAATLARIGEKSLRRALREIGGITRKGSTGMWVWQLSDQSAEDNCLPGTKTGNDSTESACQVRQVDQVDRLEWSHSPMVPLSNSPN